MINGKNTAYILLGSNLGNSIELLNLAIAQISLNCGEVELKSSVYKTKAWGNENQNDFLNQVILVKTGLPANFLLEKLLLIENTLGRERKVKWGERTMDLDLLFYENYVLNTPNLIIPHPRLHLRNFTLIPFAEIAPNFIHPVFKKTISQLLENCEDELSVLKF